MTLSTRHNAPNVNISMNNTPLKVDNKAKYLGVQLTNNMSWESHISNVCKQKIGHGIQILRRLRNVIPLEDMIKIYKTVLQPHIDYCITV